MVQSVERSLGNLDARMSNVEDTISDIRTDQKSHLEKTDDRFDILSLKIDQLQVKIEASLDAKIETRVKKVVNGILPGGFGAGFIVALQYVLDYIKNSGTH